MPFYQTDTVFLTISHEPSNICHSFSVICNPEGGGETMNIHKHFRARRKERSAMLHPFLSEVHGEKSWVIKFGIVSVKIWQGIN